MRIRLLAALAVLAAGLVTGTQRAGAEPLYGVTIDRISKASRIAQALTALPERATTRVYFEPHQPASYYATALAQIHAVSGVMGELLDSSDETSLSTEAFQAHVEEYLAKLSPDIDIWEVGNELNGNWTGPYETVAAKLTDAYDDVAAAHGVTALTLYENSFGPEHCGDGEAELTPAQFTERYVPEQVADGLHYVLLSYYPTQCGGRMPGDAEVAAELERLHALYPNAQLGFGEVSLPRHASKRTLAQAEAIMRWAYSLNPGLPYYAGGYFWWYGYEDALKPMARLAGALREAFAAESTALE
ncbi:MAG TPA: hypothetical protein VNV44_04830 [Solirubrobacteraceae bacterium]|jgi:hypothetical protein|nr:hypothetical protein [Solirubrobacteraceae bacterium]